MIQFAIARVLLLTAAMLAFIASLVVFLREMFLAVRSSEHAVKR